MAAYGVLNGTSMLSPDQDPSQPPLRSLAPPPEGSYHNREDALSFLRAWAGPQGYAMVIKRSRTNRLWIRCDRGGTYETRQNATPDSRKRKSRESRLMGCPFKVVIAYKGDSDTWKTTVEIAEHNHPPSEDLSEHPTLRRMTAEQTRKMEELTDKDYTPQECLDELKRIWPDIHIMNRDLYNARKKYKTQKAQRQGGGDNEEDGEQVQPRPFVDPNGHFPGPTPYGKWVWVTDAQEVVKKPKAKRRRTRLLEQQAEEGAEDPTPQEQQLQQQATPSSSTPSRRAPARGAAAAASNPQSAFDPALAQFDSPSTSTYEKDSSSQLLQAAAAANQLAQFLQPPSGTNAQSGSSRSAGQPQEGGLTESRIEKLEREQRATQSMLNQILGAVQGIQGSR